MENSEQTKRSLGWRWPWVTIVFLTATVFCLSWVAVTNILASKDVRIEEIRTQRLQETSGSIKK